jgi:hypothetical protein
VSVQLLLDELNDARNSLNVVVLDACRDNPFSWSRSNTRGLVAVTRQPADSIIVYATSAGARASDGLGRNGLFTSQLLKNIKTPGLGVDEVFKRTGADVAAVSGRQQIPAVYNQFFGTAYLGSAPVEVVAPLAGAAPVTTATAPAVQPAPLPPPAENGRTGTAKPETRLWTVGASAGSSFAEPWFIATLHGTIAPFNYTFVELGFDLGLLSGIKDVGYYSLYPYIHLAFFIPFSKIGGFYAGAGGGYLTAQYDFPEGKTPLTMLAADVVTGVNLFDMVDISYTLRSNFKVASNKVSIGYTYRFK